MGASLEPNSNPKRGSSTNQEMNEAQKVAEKISKIRVVFNKELRELGKSNDPKLLMDIVNGLAELTKLGFFDGRPEVIRPLKETLLTSEGPWMSGAGPAATAYYLSREVSKKLPPSEKYEFSNLRTDLRFANIGLDDARRELVGRAIVKVLNEHNFEFSGASERPKGRVPFGVEPDRSNALRALVEAAHDYRDIIIKGGKVTAALDNSGEFSEFHGAVEYLTMGMEQRVFDLEIVE